MKISSFQWKSDKIAEYWDKRAKELGSFSKASSTAFYRRSEIRIFQKYFGNLSGKKLLKTDLWNEVNNTKILLWAAREGAEVYGFDISNYLVREAEKNFLKEGLKGKFIISDMRKIKFPSNFFDFVYSMGTIEHVPEYSCAISEIYRVLKPGGMAIIGVPNKLDPFLRPVLVWVLTKIGKYPYAPEKSFTHFELEKELKRVGFKIEDKTGILFMPGILRIIDVILYKKFPFISKIIGLSLKPFEFLESHFAVCACNGYLIACVGRK
jgi:ubiquinone/menaquinone biosynthesis C-methylase UbiE